MAEEHIEGVLSLLALLLPTVQRDLGNGVDTKAAAQRRGIGSADYFDRYMVFGIPDDDLSEAAFDRALAQLTADVPGEEAAELLLRLRDDSHRITRRIEQRRSTGIRLPAAVLLKAMADSYGQLTAGVAPIASAGRRSKRHRSRLCPRRARLPASRARPGSGPTSRLDSDAPPVCSAVLSGEQYRPATLRPGA
ncbi:hypothetical protein ACFYVW_32720 [Streptomyces tendae]|uniref:hypothetical protein n=1 Tax=Streptomyces tendae TaxID=1932 RepID=UPI00367CE6F1